MPRPSEPPGARITRRRLLLAGGAGVAGAAQAAPSRELIRIGQSVPISGPAQHLGIEYQRGFQLAFEAAQASGALGGRAVELLVSDDQYEPEAALANTREFLGNDGVFALAGYVGTESIQRSLPLAVAAGVPFVAPLSGAETLRTRPSRWLYHLRPGLGAETGLIARTLATMGWQRVAVLQQADADGETGALALRAALAQAGLTEPVATAQVVRNSTTQVAWQSRDLADAAARLLAGKPQAVVFISAYASTAGVLKALRQAGFAGGAYATSLSSAAAIGPLLGPLAAGLSVTQVVPSPTDVSRPVVASYQQRLKLTGSPPPEYVSLEGWIAAQAIIEALRRMPRSGGRESFVAALESLGGHDLGGFTLRWDAVHRQASSQVALTVLDALGRPLR